MRVNIEVTAGPARGKLFCIEQADLFIVGRARDSKVSLPNDPYLSRQHFVVEVSPPNCKITDLGSKNGTFVNGVRYGGRKPDPKVKQAAAGTMSVTIQSGEIVVGDTRLKVSVDAAASMLNTLSRPQSDMPPLIASVPSPAPAFLRKNTADTQATGSDSSLGVLAPAATAPHVSPAVKPPQSANSAATANTGTPIPEAATGEHTLLEAPPPGVGDPDRTVLEAPPGAAAPHKMSALKQPVDVNFSDASKLCCVQCGKNVAGELKGRMVASGAEYICYECRANRAFQAKDRVSKRRGFDPVVGAQRVSGSRNAMPALPGMDMSQYAHINFPGYNVVDVLGSGGMGVVYKCIRQKDGLTVAVKSLLPNVPVSFENYRIFHREIQLTSKLHHPNIVGVLDHGCIKGSYYCVLEFVDGMSLKDFIQDRGGKVPLKQAAPLMLDILGGLAAAHHAEIETTNAGPKMLSGIVHRDLKPENILLQRGSFGWTPKIADFGIAKNFEAAGMTDMTIAGVCGTPTYWPREQLTHYRYLHPATDVFSIAAVFYEMLSGKCARPGMQETLVHCQRRSVSPELADFMRVIGSNPIPPIREAVPTLPAPVAAVIDRALLEVEVPLDEADMRDTLARLRYSDAGEFREKMAEAFAYANFGI